MLKVLRLLTIASLPLAAAQDGQSFATPGPSGVKGTGSVGTDSRSLAEDGGGIARPFGKSAKTKPDKGKSAKSSQDKKSAGAKSQNLFDKSGKSSKSSKKVVVAADETPHKIFAKSKKGSKSSAKSGKSAALFPKSGKSKASKGNIHHQSDHMLVPLTSAVDANVGTTDEPSSSPTVNGDNIVASISPTLPPTPCNSSTVQDDFDLCIAIDASGSVCGNFGGIDCTSCRPSAFCQDYGIDQDTCCGNFAKVKEFSSAVVTSLEEFPVEKSFSVVQFSADATKESELSAASVVLQALDGMVYRGGSTNHASAIEACQQTLSSTFTSSGGIDERKKFILLITDGVPTAPQPNPEYAAEAAATSAEEENEIVVIPVFISANYEAEALAFMIQLSSNGEVYDVEDFESLGSLQGSLLKQVSCS